MIETPLFSPILSRQAAQRCLAQVFAQAGLENPELDARILLCEALAIDHVGLIRDPDEPIGAGADTLAALCRRRLAHEPVARILGRREFWGLELAITPMVLDPRSDTETLIEAARDFMQARRHAALRVLDLGTGSGAILAAILSLFPRAIGYGVDVSGGAAAVAKANLERLGLRDRGFVICGDWTDALRGPFDLIVANPPYIVRDEIAELALEVRGFDPRIALDGGEDGLAAYRQLSPAVATLLATGGAVLFECGAGQAADVAGLLRAAGLTGVDTRRDLGGHNRVVIGRLNTLGA